ncbi:MAG: FAD-dependent oxidoreductase [Geminicoccaceae bacterium]
MSIDSIAEGDILLRDFRAYDGDDDIYCDVCIAGAGAAGVALALSLAKQHHKVVLLEAGGFDYEEETQDPYVGESVGRPYHDLVTTRLRFLGGSTNHWGGMCSHLDPHDFEKRSWVPHSGWPIGFEDLRPWYEEAQAWVELGAFDYRRDAISPEGTRYLPFDEERLRHKMWHYSRPPTNFGIEHRAKLEMATSLDIFLYANLVDIELGRLSDEVKGFVVQSYGGKKAMVRARHFVLALGGLENPRLLLNATADRAAGIGNERDLVGRFFMEHLNADAGQVATVDDKWSNSYDSLFHGDRQYRAFLLPSEKQQQELRILGSAIGLGPLFHARERSVAYESLHKIKMAWLRRRMPDDLGGHISNLISDATGLKEALEERFDPTVYLYTEAEQAPNPDSRVMLARNRDALGLQRLRLDWRLSEIDKRSIREMAYLIGEELGRMNKGRVGLPPWLLEEAIVDDDPMVGGYHHMGTTRMSVDPSTGVVDSNCRIFSTANLYVAGSSVFTTGGAANPTLTIVALALRLADHLDQELALQSNATVEHSAAGAE